MAPSAGSGRFARDLSFGVLIPDPAQAMMPGAATAIRAAIETNLVQVRHVCRGWYGGYYRRCGPYAYYLPYYGYYLPIWGLHGHHWGHHGHFGGGAMAVSDISAGATAVSHMEASAMAGDTATATTDDHPGWAARLPRNS